MEAVLNNSQPTRDERARLEMPVLMKEMRSRMRGKRMPILLGATSSSSVAVGLFFLLTQWPDLFAVSTVPQKIMAVATLGHNLFFMLIVTQAALCLFIAPALTAGSIAGEAEQQSLEMLLLSRLPLAILIQSFGFSNGGSNGLERWLIAHICELSLLMLLALAWAYLIFTTQRLCEMRKPVG